MRSKFQKKTGFAAIIGKHAKNISFHTPGHNNKLPKSLVRLDATELAYSGNLLESQGITKELEDKISRTYHATSAFISTNGATNSILTAVYALKAYGGFLIWGEAHISVYNAFRIAKARAFQTEFLPEQPPEGVRTLVVTYPDYFGRCLDLAAVKKYAEANNLFLFVDSSHGSHFMFYPKLPLSATIFADLAVCSMHKTLPVCTGGAVLLCNNSQLCDNLVLTRKLFHSTSPSYMTMASMDYAIDLFVAKGQRLYDKVFAALEKFNRTDIGDFEIERNHDASRLVVTSKYVAAAVSAELSKFGIDVEMSYENKVVAIVTPFNYKKLPKFALSLRKISALDLPTYIEKKPDKKCKDIKLIDFDGDFELVDIEKSVGRRAYCGMGIYPPGTPIIGCGEIITSEAAELLKKNSANSFGLVNGRVAVLLYNGGGL
jgi:arginine/lysine/ornithine decarboxylase